MSNNLNIRSQKTLRELEEALSNLNIPILVFKDLLKAIKNNDFSNLSGSVNKLRYMTSEEKVKEQIDNVIYQQVYNSNDYNNLIILITKIYSIIDSLVEARMNITDVYKQDIEVVENMLDSYGFDIHKIFDENSKRDLAHRIYYFLRRKGTPDLIGEFLNKLGYTHYAINEYSLNRENTEWKLIPENIKLSDAAQDWKDELFFNNINLNEIDDALWYLDEDTLNNIFFKNTRLYPKGWSADYEIDEYDILSRYLGFSITDEVKIDSVSFSKCGEKMAITCGIWFQGYSSGPEFEPTSYKVKDGFGETVLTEIDEKYMEKASVFIIDLKKNEIEKEYIMYDDGWFDYYLDWYMQNGPSWEPNTEYKEGDAVLYEGELYICRRDHISSSTFSTYLDGIYTWTTSTYYLEYNWWTKQGYLEYGDIDFHTFYTTYFEDLNNIYVVLNQTKSGRFLKINILDNTITTLDISDFKNKYTGESLKDFFGERLKYAIFSIIGKYEDYLIFGSPEEWNADHTIYIGNTYLFFNLKEKTWFSLYDKFFKYYPTDSFAINVFDLYYGFYSHEIAQNKLWFTVNIDYKNYLMGLDLEDIIDHIDIIDSFGSDLYIENVEQKRNYVKNIMDNYFKISLEEFDPDFMVEFLIGRDNNIYISGYSLDILENGTYEDFYFDNEFVFKAVDKQGNEIKTIFSGEMISPWGMDYKNNLICTVSTNTGWWPKVKIYVNEETGEYESLYIFPIIKLAPVFYYKKDILNNSNVKLDIIKYLNMGDMYFGYKLEYIYNPLVKTEVEKVSYDQTSFVHNNELYVFMYNRAYKYNISDDCWVDMSPHILYGFLYFYNNEGAIYYNGHVYFIGHDGKPLTIYNMSTKKAIMRETPIGNRDDFTVELINKKIYIFGGFYNFHHNDIWEYDIEKSVWTEKSPCPVEHSNHSSTVYNNKMYIFGGRNRSGNLNDTWVYDPANDTWAQKAVFPGSKDSKKHAATTIGDKMYYYVKREMWEYDPIADIWTSKAQGYSDMPNYGGYIMETVLGKACLFGGSTNFLSNKTNKLWVYDPVTNFWTQKSSNFCGQ